MLCCSCPCVYYLWCLLGIVCFGVLCFQYVSVRNVCQGTIFVWSSYVANWTSTGHGGQSCSWSTVHWEKQCFPWPCSHLKVWSCETCSGVSFIPASIRSLSISRPFLVLTHGLLCSLPPSTTTASSINTTNRHRISPEFIGLRNCASMVFTKTLLTRGHYPSIRQLE